MGAHTPGGLDGLALLLNNQIHTLDLKRHKIPMNRTNHRLKEEKIFNAFIFVS